MSSLVAVVVTYNRLQKLKTSIAALLAERCDAIVVVENCSNDGSREWLQQHARRHERLDVVLAPRNLGGAGGFAMGLRHALARYESQWLVCIDDDAYPNAGAFDAFFESDLIGVDAAAAAVYAPDGGICEMNRPSLNPFWHWRLLLKTVVLRQGRRGFHVRDECYSRADAVAIDATSFVGFFIRRGMVEQIGLPDQRLFLYGDDVLYALSVRRACGQIRFLSGVTFTHDCETFATHEKKFTPPWKAYYTYRNGLLVYRAAAGKLFWLFLPFKLASWIASARLYDNPRSHLRVVYTALKDWAGQHYDRPHEEIVSLAAVPAASKADGESH